MYGLHFLRELVRNVDRCRVEEFLSFCQRHPAIRPYAVITDVPPENILRELTPDEYWAYLARRAWLLQLHGENGEVRTVQWQDFLQCMPQTDRDAFTYLTTENFWPTVELFVWLFHGPAYGGFAIDPGKGAVALDDEVDTPVSQAAQRSKAPAPRRRGEDGSIDWYYQLIAQYPLLPRETEVQLARFARMGDPYAANALVLANLRFAASIARTHQGRGLPLQDLIQAASLGLMKAAKRFDPERGFKFISYAVWWVRQSILDAIAEEGRVVRLPLNRLGSINRLRKLSQTLEQRLGREVTAADIAAALDVSIQHIEADLTVARHAASLDEPLKGDDGNESTATLFDLIWDPRAVRPARTILARGAREEINRALETLETREAEVLDKYYGINYENVMTLEEIGAHYSLTRERVRQIKEKALTRLRHQKRSKTLFGYFLKLEGKR